MLPAYFCPYIEHLPEHFKVKNRTFYAAGPLLRMFNGIHGINDFLKYPIDSLV